MASILPLVKVMLKMEVRYKTPYEFLEVVRFSLGHH